MMHNYGKKCLIAIAGFSTLAVIGPVLAQSGPVVVEAEQLAEARNVGQCATTGTEWQDQTRILTCSCNGGIETWPFVWGDGVYSSDSNICTAALHAGVVSKQDGGQVYLRFIPGQDLYGSATRNGVASKSYGEWERSFQFLVPAPEDE